MPKSRNIPNDKRLFRKCNFFTTCHFLLKQNWQLFHFLKLLTLYLLTPDSGRSKCFPAMSSQIEDYRPSKPKICPPSLGNRPDVYKFKSLTSWQNGSTRQYAWLAHKGLVKRQKFLWAVRCNHFRNGKYCTFWREAAELADKGVNKKILFWRGCREGYIMLSTRLSKSRPLLLSGLVVVELDL